jgi:hypothetical protein
VFLNALHDLFARRGDKPFVGLVDMTATSNSRVLDRSKIAAFFKETGSYWRRNCVGYAFVVKSALQRGAITAVFWVAPLGWPTKVFAAREKADGWLAGRAEKAGLSYPVPSQNSEVHPTDQR